MSQRFHLNTSAEITVSQI